MSKFLILLAAVAALMLSTMVAFSPLAAVAQDATPVTTQATPAAGEPVSLLFVQTASSSTLTPLESPDGEATHELILQERSDQTIFFADRPSRLVGTVPTTELLDLFASEADNPPNAALVALNEAGEEEIIVLELLSGTEDATTGELTWQVKLLADYLELEFGLGSEPVTEVTEARSYGDTSLFIDDAGGPDICGLDWTTFPPSGIPYAC